MDPVFKQIVTKHSTLCMLLYTSADVGDKIRKCLTVEIYCFQAPPDRNLSETTREQCWLLFCTCLQNASWKEVFLKWSDSLSITWVKWESQLPLMNLTCGTLSATLICQPTAIRGNCLSRKPCIYFLHWAWSCRKHNLRYTLSLLATIRCRRYTFVYLSRTTGKNLWHSH